jgi:hypothetical protein
MRPRFALVWSLRLWVMPLWAMLAAGPSSAGPRSLDAALDADSIYERVLANRFDASVHEVVLTSGDRAGRVQLIELQMLWRRYEAAAEDDGNGVLSRSLVRYLEPGDVRGSGYLVINKRQGPDDQFMYMKSMRRIRRVNLSSETVIGTDLSLEDLVPRELDDARVSRAADDTVDGTPCYVIDARPVESVDSAYSRFSLYVEPVHFVPLRTRYFDRAGVEIKELRADARSIREIDGVWMPLEATMRQLQDQTYTKLKVRRLVPNPDLPKRYFSQRQLQARRFHLPDEVMAHAHVF